jgi:hypothetical protein
MKIRSLIKIFVMVLIAILVSCKQDKTPSKIIVEKKLNDTIHENKILKKVNFDSIYDLNKHKTLFLSFYPGMDKETFEYFKQKEIEKRNLKLINNLTYFIFDKNEDFQLMFMVQPPYENGIELHSYNAYKNKQEQIKDFDNKISSIIETYHSKYHIIYEEIVDSKSSLNRYFIFKSATSDKYIVIFAYFRKYLNVWGDEPVYINDIFIRYNNKKGYLEDLEYIKDFKESAESEGFDKGKVLKNI